MKINLSQCCPLFSGISENEMDKLLSCLDARERRYQESLAFQRDKKSPVSAFAIWYSGNPAGRFPGKYYHCRTDYPRTAFLQRPLWVPAFALPVAVLSTELLCYSMALDYNKLLSPCQYACPFSPPQSSKYGENPANKNIFLNARIGHLSNAPNEKKKYCLI